MPQYSGNLVGNTVLAQNYRRTAASSNFGTRKLAWYTVLVEPDVGLVANYAENNSLYYNIVRSIQTGNSVYIPFTEDNQRIGNGGGAELFYVGTPQNSATNTLNQEANWYGFKLTNTSGSIEVARASGTGTIATLEFVSAQGTPPFNVGEPVAVANIGHGYDCDFYTQQFVTECTTTYVKFNSTATDNVYDGGDSIGQVETDRGWDCFTFAVVDDAEPILPEGSGIFANGDPTSGTDYSGVASDSECYFCSNGRNFSIITPVTFWFDVYEALHNAEVGGADFNIFRLKPSFGLTQI